MVVIVDGDKVAQPEMSSDTSCLAGDTFHGTSITEEREGVVVDQFKPRFVEHGCSMGLCNGEANSVCETLTKRSGCNFNSWSVMSLGVTWSYAVYLLLQKSVHENFR